MRLLYHDLVGRRVVTADGRSVGRIATLRAEPREGSLRVVSLLIGPGALVERIARRAPATEVAWSLVRRVGERVELRVTSAQLARVLDESWEELSG